MDKFAEYSFLLILAWNFCSQNDFIRRFFEFFLARLAAQVSRVALDFNSEFFRSVHAKTADKAFADHMVRHTVGLVCLFQSR